MTSEWRAQPADEAWERVRDERPAPRRTALIIGSVATIAAGVVAVIVPAVASVGIAIFTGIVLVAAGGALGLGVFAAEGLGLKLLTGIAGLLTLAAGIYLLASPLEGTFTLTVILVIWLVAVGIAQIAGGIAARGSEGAGYTIFAGVVSLVLGVLVATELPSSGDWAIGLLVGIQLIFLGVVSLFRALEL
ncbi:MAG TPA: DUF308 domain-containing protein [Thermoleophilaceae bacterium]|nr:DUF308 domain-containing protein [Thermoleophilaceae bacterium]